MNTIIHARAVGSTPVEKYLRVASLAIAFYDFLKPVAQRPRINLVYRYSSILVMIVSNYGVFATSFTLESCRRYYYVSPIMKGPIVSRGGAGRSGFFSSHITPSQFLLNGSSIYIAVFGGCISGVDSPHPTSWPFYLVAMCYDLVTLFLSTIYLLHFETYSSRFKRFVRIMIYDGLIFFVALTVDLHTNNVFIATRQVFPARDAESASRSPFESSKGQRDHSGSRVPTRANDMELNVRICIEHAVAVDNPLEEEDLSCSFKEQKLCKTIHK
ncbi:hypothetical protein V8B97DRAFT_1918678 [Scleroderma yunnanense]